MNKFRILSKEELKHLEEELKHFLIVNGVHDEEWKRLNREEADKATKLVGLFSDNVLRKVYENIQYIEHRSPESCLVFHAGPQKLELISIQKKTGSSVDLSTPESIHKALVQHPNELTWFKTDKMYSKDREEEIHQMLERGCVPSTKEFWGQLNEVLEN